MSESQGVREGQKEMDVSFPTSAETRGKFTALSPERAPVPRARWPRPRGTAAPRKGSARSSLSLAPAGRTAQSPHPLSRAPRPARSGDTLGGGPGAQQRLPSPLKLPAEDTLGDGVPLPEAARPRPLSDSPRDGRRQPAGTAHVLSAVAPTPPLSPGPSPQPPVWDTVVLHEPDHSVVHILPVSARAHTYAYTHTLTHSRTHLHVLTHSHTHMFTHSHVLPIHTHTLTHARTCSHTYTCAHTWLRDLSHLPRRRVHGPPGQP